MTLAIFDLIFFILVGNKDMHKSLDEFGFRPESTTDSYMELAALEGLKVYPSFFQPF